MIYSPLSFFNRSVDMPQSPLAQVSADGQALVSTVVNGLQAVTPSTGVAGEKFVGFSSTQTSAIAFFPTNTTKVQELEVPVSGIVTVSKTPLAGTVYVSDKATGAPIVVVSVVGMAVDLGVANAGKIVNVVYRYSLTVTEARAMAGDIQPGGYSGNTYGVVGVAQSGVIYTDQFDSAVNWAAATAVKLGANGLITDQAGAGEAINAVVKAVPSISYPFLGIQFNAAN